MKRARIATLQAAAKSRPPGYLEACLAAGTLSPDKQWVIFPDAAHNALRAKYNPALHALTSRPAAPPSGISRRPCGCPQAP